MNLLRTHPRECSVAAAYAALLILLALLKPTFFQGQFAATLVAAAPILVAAVGMSLVILTRHIDISIGSQFSIAAVVAGLLARSGVPMPMVVVITLAVGALLGSLNGVLIALLGLPSIVVTLATMAVLREALRWVREGESVRDLPANFQWFGVGQTSGQLLIIGLALAVFFVIAWIMNYVAAGRCIYAVGSDLEAARLAGVRPRRVVFSVFVLMGMLTALAAVLQAVRFAQVDAGAGAGLELQAIAAVVVGGTSINGGRGTLAGTLLGVLLLGSIGAALGFLGEQAYWDRAFQGAIILLAVASDGLQRRRATA